MQIDVIKTDNVPSEYRLIQVRFPKTKRKRIRKKWAKRRKNFEYKEVPKFYRIGNKVYLKPKFYEWFLNKMKLCKS